MPTIEVNDKEMKLLEKFRQEEKEQTKTIILMKAVSACSNAIIINEKIGLSYTEFITLITGNIDYEMYAGAIQSMGIVSMNVLYEMSHKLARYIAKEVFDFNKGK